LDSRFFFHEGGRLGFEIFSMANALSNQKYLKRNGKMRKIDSQFQSRQRKGKIIIH